VSPFIVFVFGRWGVSLRMKCIVQYVLSIAACFGGLLASNPSFGQYLELTEAHLEAIGRRYDDAARDRVSDWRQLMMRARELASQQDGPRVKQANDFFNRVRWVSDIEHWGKEDYWATPIETLATNAGDCEDFSIGKYFTLNEVGVDKEKIRITYVKALEFNQAHMVLAYYATPESEPLILDNINKTILPASQRTDLLPIYSFNGDSLWLAKARGRKLNADSQKSLPQWREVNERMLSELLK